MLTMAGMWTETNRQRCSGYESGCSRSTEFREQAHYFSAQVLIRQPSQLTGQCLIGNASNSHPLIDRDSLCVKYLIESVPL